jgi:O-antigen/teichoic acid export membrane protein
MSPTIARLYIASREKLLQFLQMYLAISMVIGCGSALALYLLSDWIVLKLFGPQLCL